MNMASGNKKITKRNEKKHARKEERRGKKQQDETAINHVVNVYDPI
ncbi:hypothetical protein GLW00_07700 [Halobacillus litoralis]|uniref:Uncharacterized protein n=1 Tax=Halobacillus litoralis TaxID=45668 RepID=A0A845FA13_9BACI|nr:MULTISPECIES: hypothetical protein [Halobacillus]MBN9656487.1 hypothetical protein [Halobacillus sp. GSS1]MYL70729.1 hypothetical protein [Halobacillus litoralis]